MEKSIQRHDDGFKKYGAKRYHNRAIPSNSSFFANSEIISTVPRSYGNDISLKEMPYVKKIKAK